MLEDHAYLLTDTLNVADVVIQLDTIHHNPALLMLFQMVDTADRC